MEWTEDELKFFVDGQYIGSYYNQNNGHEQWPYDQEFFIILNLAIGSHFMPCATENEMLPQRYEIDYVRVYQLSDINPGDIIYDINFGKPTHISTWMSITNSDTENCAFKVTHSVCHDQIEFYD